MEKITKIGLIGLIAISLMFVSLNSAFASQEKLISYRYYEDPGIYLFEIEKSPELGEFIAVPTSQVGIDYLKSEDLGWKLVKPVMGVISDSEYGIIVLLLFNDEKEVLSYRVQ